MQSKDKWISIEIRKYTEGTMQALLNELNTYENKVSSAVFNPENRTLTVYYAATLSYDDILQVVSRYYSDFTKTGGTELQ